MFTVLPTVIDNLELVRSIPFDTVFNPDATGVWILEERSWPCPVQSECGRTLRGSELRAEEV